MGTKMRRNFAGACRARSEHPGTWRIDCAAPRAAQIIVCGADPHAAAVFDAPLRDVGLEWQTRGVLLTMLSGGTPATVEADAVIVHEPAADPYAALPLGEFDAPARRFWHRVFFLVRIPGGRSLLGLLAHLSRKRS
jgi:hypothetical protein